MTARTRNLPGAYLRVSQASACLLLTFAINAPAQAQGNAADSDRANVLFKRGKNAFNDGKFSDALRIYSEAWQLKHSPDIAANLAQTESELGKHRDAAEHFAFALAHLLPSSTDDQKRALADGLDVEKKEVGTLHVTLEPADAALSVDDARVTLPASGDLYVEPGEHRCSATLEGYDANSQTVQVSKGGSQVLWIKLNPVGGRASAGIPPMARSGLANDSAVSTPDSSPPEPRVASARSLVPAVVGGGLVVAGAVVGVAFLLSANSSQTDADNIKASLTGDNPCGTGTPNGAQCADLHDKNSAIDHARTVEVVGFAVAGAAALGTALYLLWPHGSPSTARIWAPSFALAPGSGSVGLFARF